MKTVSNQGFAKDESGAVLAEALIAFPVLTIVTFGLLEFGNMMWERQQLAIGVRDAARYWSRCRAATASYASTCNESTARAIAFYGTPQPAANEFRRVPDWDQPGQLVITPSKSSLSTIPGPADIITVIGTVTYQGSPAFSAILSTAPTISYSVEMRQIGW